MDDVNDYGNGVKSQRIGQGKGSRDGGSRFRIRGLPRVFEKGLARGIFFALLEKRNMDSVRATRRKTHGDLGQGRDAPSQGPEQEKEHRP